MLAFAEKYLCLTRSAASDRDIISILGQLAQDLGYRSAYLIEYASSLKTAIMLLDSNAARAGWWENYLASGLRASPKTIADMLAKGGVQYVDETRFGKPAESTMAFARRVDIADAAMVPINFDQEIVGLIAFCGQQQLDADQERALQFICYNLFSQARSFQTHEHKPSSAGLTPREREVMELSAVGLTSDKIAADLGMSPRTVNQHLDNIAAKLGTRNRVHTVAEAIRRGLLA